MNPFHYYFIIDFETVLDWFWIGFGNNNLFVYFQNKCHIPYKIYGIYIVDIAMLND